MKLTIEIEADSPLDAFNEALSTIRANLGLCQSYPQMVRDIGPIEVDLSAPWWENEPKPEPFGKLTVVAEGPAQPTHWTRQLVAVLAARPDFSAEEDEEDEEDGAENATPETPN